MSRGLLLQWEGKRVYRQRIPKPRLLEPVIGLSVPPTSGDDCHNMIIEGDNLQVLTSLKSRFEGAVDVVYIDPPYNLGTGDFRYSDRRFHDPDADDSDAVYVTNEDGGKHTKWLNFMAPRLYLLWQMLKETGVIFISINDTELFRLGMLLNEVFDERNWIGTLVWHGSTDNNPTRIAQEHEYVLCYAKNQERLPGVWASRDSEVKTLMLDTFERLKGETASHKELQKQYNAFAKEAKDLLGDLYRYRHLDARGPYAARRNLDNPGKPGHQYDVLHPVTGKACSRPRWGYRYTYEAMQKLLSEDRILFGKTEKRIPQLKVHLDEVTFPLRSVFRLDSRGASNDLARLFEGARDKFKNPKPVELIEQLLSYTTDANSLVLDAFGGSGTTAEAVLRMNARDNGKRRFILIEEGSSSDKYCRTLTAERVRRAIKVDGYKDGFNYYQTGRKIDREAIISMERDGITALICQADETGRGRGVTRLTGFEYIIGKNHRNEAICLLWNGDAHSEVTKDDMKRAAAEVTKAGLKRPFRMWGTNTNIADTDSWKFCQIPDEILAQMHIREDMEGD